ncbi:MAG: acyl-CoA dehydratase activase [Planctomycetota bacterium]|jgi:predicted CoA-substrate-specific enzyme activase
MICAGIDAGSRAIKIILMGAEGKKVLAKGVRDQGVEQDKLTLGLFESLLKQKGIKKRDIRRTVATGYGRSIVTLADTTITEITCHAVGVRHRVPQAMSVIDIGGQDSKVIRLDGSGRVRDFAMNDRCAAGTGRFLEVVAARLGAELESLGEMAGRSGNPAAISSMCVVFAETEIIGLLASGIPRQDIVAGVQKAIAARIAAMAGQNLDAPVILTGGVARISGMRQALESVLGRGISVAPEPQMTGALGAALLACEQVNGEEV